MHSNRVSKRSSGLRGVRGQGLACGSNYSCGCGDAAVNPTPSSSCGCSSNLGIVSPSTQTLTITTTGNRFSNLLAPVSNAITMAPPSPMSYFREGLAFGVAWAASMERGVTIPPQWHSDLERVSQSQGTSSLPGLPSSLQIALGSSPDSNRAAFVYGFDMGIRVYLERRTSLTSRAGRVYSLDFLRTQGRVVANTLFGQARAAVLPAITGPTGMAPSYTPGVVAPQPRTYYTGVRSSCGPGEVRNPDGSCTRLR